MGLAGESGSTYSRGGGGDAIRCSARLFGLLKVGLYEAIVGKLVPVAIDCGGGGVE